MTWQFVLTGLLIGALVGMTGMGGGSLMTPILVIVFGFTPTLAVGTDILHGAIFKTVGAIRHRRLGTVHHQLSGWMFLGSAPFSLLGVAVGTRLTHAYGDRATEVMGYILGSALLLGAAGLVLKSFVKGKVDVVEIPPLVILLRGIRTTPVFFRVRSAARQSGGIQSLVKPRTQRSQLA